MAGKAEAPKSFAVLCRELSLGNPRRIRAMVERVEADTGRQIAFRRVGRTGKTVITITEAVLRRELPALFDDERRDAMRKVNYALAEIEKRQQEIAELAVQGYTDRKLDSFLREQRKLREDIEMLAGVLNRLDTQMQISEALQTSTGVRTQDDHGEGGEE